MVSSRFSKRLLTLMFCAILVPSTARAAPSGGERVSANDAAKWSEPSVGPYLTAFRDGTLLVTRLSGSPIQTMSPETGAVLNPSFPGADTRSAVWVNEENPMDLVVGGFSDKQGYWSNGDLAWWWSRLGCCNNDRMTMALDLGQELGFINGGFGLWAVDLNLGELRWMFSIGDEQPIGILLGGHVSVASAETVYLAGSYIPQIPQQLDHIGVVQRIKTTQPLSKEWQIHVDPSVRLRPGAVAADGSIVVTSGNHHPISQVSPGVLARVSTDGTLTWKHQNDSVTPPVIGAGDRIFVGIHSNPASPSDPGFVRAYDLTTGAEIWSTQVNGLPNDLLVADDGLVYALVGPPGTGELVSLDQTTGTLCRTVTDMPGTWEMILLGGVIYAGGGGKITAIPVPAFGYDPGAPWPVRMHDNQRTSSAEAPLLNVPRGEPPVAEAGDNQSIHGGQTVHLDGSGSHDDETPSESLLYDWSFVSIPAGSTATLAGAGTAAPSFVVDLLGDYVIQLIVTDSAGLSSDPDTVTVSSNNVAPNADAGADQGTFMGDRVVLDGSGSSDEDEDPLSFAWTLTEVPAGSTATLGGANTPQPTLVPDLPGTYTASLVVNDGFADSAPDTVTVLVVSVEEFACALIADALNQVAKLDSSSVTTKGNQTALQNFLKQACRHLQKGEFLEGRQKLEQAMERTDGCALRGLPDGGSPLPGGGAERDYINNCADQDQVYPLLQDALGAIGS